MSNLSERETRVRLLPTIHYKIKTSQCRPLPRLASGYGSQPSPGVDTPTTTKAMGQKGPLGYHELGALFYSQVQRARMWKGGRQLLLLASGRMRGSVVKPQNGAQEGQGCEETAGDGVEGQTHCRNGSRGKENLRPPKPTRSQYPNHCVKTEQLWKT